MLSKRNRDLDLEYQGKVRTINDNGKAPTSAPVPIDELKPLPAENREPLKKRSNELGAHKLNIPCNDGMDSVTDKQKAKDLITGRKPSEIDRTDAEGEQVPASPYDLSRMITEELTRQSPKTGIPPEPGVEPDGGGQANSPAKGKRKGKP